MASPPQTRGLWRFSVLWDGDHGQAGRSLTYALGPEHPSRDDVFSAALHVGDAWVGTDGFFEVFDQPTGIQPSVLADAFFPWGPTVVATSHEWTYTGGTYWQSNTACVVVEGELDWSTVAALPGRRRGGGRWYVPWVPVASTVGQSSSQLEPGFLENLREQAQNLHGRLAAWSDPSGGMWGWVVPVRRLPPEGGTWWGFLPVTSATVRATVGYRRSRSHTLVAGSG